MDPHSSSSSLEPSVSPSKNSSSLCCNQECAELLLPPHWFHKHSRSKKGKVYFANSLLRKVSWELPLFEPCEANCRKCKNYAKCLEKTKAESMSNSDTSSSASKISSKARKCDATSQNSETKLKKGLVKKSSIFNKQSYDLGSANFSQAKCLMNKKSLTRDKSTENNFKNVSLHSKSSSIAHSSRNKLTKQSDKVKDCTKFCKFPLKNNEHSSVTSNVNQEDSIKPEPPRGKSLSPSKNNKNVSNANQLLLRKKSFSNLKAKVFGTSLVKAICLGRKSNTAKKCLRSKTSNKVDETKIAHSSQSDTYKSVDTSLTERKRKVNLDEELLKRKKAKLDNQLSSLAGNLNQYKKMNQALDSSTPEQSNALLPLEICAIGSLCKTSNKVDKRTVHSSQNDTYKSVDTSLPERKVNLDEKLFKSKKAKLDNQLSSLAGNLNQSIKTNQVLDSSTPEQPYALHPLETFTFESMDVDYNSVTSNVQEEKQVPSQFSNTGLVTRNHEDQDDNSTLWVVVDTNLLVHDLSLIKSLSTGVAVYKKYEKLMIMIPHTAIRELDVLKKDSKCQVNAQLAVKWINKVLEQPFCVSTNENLINGAHNVCGQSLKNYNDLRDKADDKNGDDRILDFCLWLKQHGHEVLLLSNDINFRNKAIFAEVPSVGSKSLSKDLSWASETSATLQMDQAFNVSSHERASSSPSLRNSIQIHTNVQSNSFDVHMNDVSVNSCRNDDSHSVNHLSSSKVVNKFPNTLSASKNTPSPCSKRFHTSVCSSLQTTLSNILRARMESVFPDLWLSIVIRKPPWSLSDLFACWKKHWVAVFTDIFPHQLQNDLKLFQDMLKKKTSKEELYEKLCKIYESLSTDDFRHLIKYPQNSFFNHKHYKNFSLRSAILKPDSYVPEHVDQNSNVIRSTDSSILTDVSEHTSFSEIHPSTSSSFITSHCTSADDLQTSLLLPTSNSQSPSFFNDHSMWLDVHPKLDGVSEKENCLLDETSFHRNQDSVDTCAVAEAQNAFLATGEKMGALVCEGLSSLATADVSARTQVLASLQSLRGCIRALRAALSQCHENPSASDNFERLRYTIVEFWANVHQENAAPVQVFSAASGAAAAAALLRSKEQSFWSTCQQHLWQMESALNAELPEGNQTS